MDLRESPHWWKILEFGRELIQTEDLDPVYVAIVKTDMANETKYRLLLAYWCFYHLGVSAFLAEQDGEDVFWRLMNMAAVNPDGKWPRGTERRHFRGDLAISSMSELSECTVRSRFGEWFSYHPGRSMPFSMAAERVQISRGFGPWIAFKVADMAERILGIPVDFSECDMGVYRDPAMAAALLIHGDKKAKLGPGELKGVMIQLEAGLRSRLRGEVYHGAQRGDPAADFQALAPPTYNREINAQEVETVMCKYKSHVGGHYPMGKDTRELREALEGWGPLAERLLKSMPEMVI